VGNVSFVCWITSDGQRYVWRAEEDRLLVGRYEGAHTYWAKIDGVVMPKAYRSLRLAMLAGYRALVMDKHRRRA
jgi:hypothetical protein